MKSPLPGALEELTREGPRLRNQWRFEWSERTQQTLHRLRLEYHERDVPVFAAVMGGASSGKSTVFNNLLSGHLASRITARGHATRGPILAVHDDRLPRVQALLDKGLLFPGYQAVTVELDDNVTGNPGAVAVLGHQLDALRNVWLFDTPDFTSEAAFKEGDVAMSILPWFDRLVVVVDHERWFDRQSITKLRTHSAGLAQERFALFNRTREEPLTDADKRVLEQQAERLSAAGRMILDFRRGRGFRVFSPGTLDPILSFFAAAPPRRTQTLLRQVAEVANRALNQNEQRTAHRDELRTSLYAAVTRVLPAVRDCMSALMTAEERRRLELVTRVLRIQDATKWMHAQRQRVVSALRRLPLLGPIVSRPMEMERADNTEGVDRLAVATRYYEAVFHRQTFEVERIARASAFWNELRRWTGLEPSTREVGDRAPDPGRLRIVVEAYDSALKHWTARVEDECRGLGPHLSGAVTLGTVALAVVLIAAPGPVTALTLVSAKGAIAAGLGQLATAAGAGALFGRQMGRLAAAIQEKLLGSAEFNAVQAAAAEFRQRLDSLGRRVADDAVGEASAFVLDPGEPLAKALEVIRRCPEET